MGKRFATAYTIFSVIVFSFLIVWFVIRGINTRDGNIIEAGEDLENLAQTISSAYLAGGSFSSSHFQEQIFAKVDDKPRLRALMVITKVSGVEFLYATEPDYIPQGKEPGTIETFSYNRLTEEFFSVSIIIPQVPGTKAIAVYRIFPRNEVFPIIRELLIGLLSFLLITAILIIVFPQIAIKERQNAFGPPVADKRAMDKNELQETATPAKSDVESNRESIRLKDTAPPEEHDLGAEPQTPSPVEPPPIEQLEPIQEQVEEPKVQSDEVKDEGLYSPNSRLGWEKYLEERLSAELKRAASFDQDLVLLLASVGGLKKSDKLYESLSQTAQEFFNFQDLCFEYGKSGIGVIIPNADIDQGIERIEAFMKRVDDTLSDAGFSGRFTAGISARNGRLMSGKRIIREADSALHRAKSGDENIVAFRVDPEKYRNYIAGKATSNRG